MPPASDKQERLCEAIRQGDSALVAAVIADGADVNVEHTTSTAGGWHHLPQPPALLAAKYGQWDVVKLLLHKGANPDCKSSCERPVHYAAHSSSLEAVKLVLGFGADLHVVDRFGASVLHWACMPDENPAAAINVLKYLIDEKGFDANLVDYDNRTALFRSSFYVPFLLSRGASLDVVDVGGFTALHRALQLSRHGSARHPRVFMNVGADLVAKKSPLFSIRASTLQYPATREMVYDLLDRGANLWEAQQGEDRPRCTPLAQRSIHGVHEAFQCRNQELFMQHSLQVVLRCPSMQV